MLCIIYIFLLLNELDISHAASKAYAANGGIFESSTENQVTRMIRTYIYARKKTA